MKSFYVQIEQIERYVVPVEAKNELDAIDRAYELIEDKQGKAKFHDDSDGNESVEEI